MYKMRVTVTLMSLLSLIVLFNLTSAVLVETCGPNAVYRREDGTLARREDGTLARREDGTLARREDGTLARREDGTLVRRGVFKNCWDSWSRCSGFSKFLTGIIWETCPECCKKKGYNGGNCNLHPSKCPLSSEAYVCDCY